MWSTVAVASSRSASARKPTWPRLTPSRGTLGPPRVLGAAQDRPVAAEDDDELGSPSVGCVGVGLGDRADVDAARTSAPRPGRAPPRRRRPAAASRRRGRCRRPRVGSGAPRAGSCGSRCSCHSALRRTTAATERSSSGSPGRVLTQSRYSRFPVVPRMGLGSSPHGCRPAVRAAARTSSSTRSCSCARGDDAGPGQPLPADLELRLDQQDRVRAWASSPGRDDVEDQPQRDEAEVGDDDVERLTEVTGPHVADVRAPSAPSTRGVVGDLRHQLAVATSRAVTCAAPASSSTWVNPPVLAPTSRQRRPATVSPALRTIRRAASSLYAARPTHRSGSSARAMLAVGLTGVLGLAPSRRRRGRRRGSPARGPAGSAADQAAPDQLGVEAGPACPGSAAGSGSVTTEVGQPVLQRPVCRLAGLGLLVEGPGLGAVVEPLPAPRRPGRRRCGVPARPGCGPPVPAPTPPTGRCRPSCAASRTGRRRTSSPRTSLRWTSSPWTSSRRTSSRWPSWRWPSSRWRLRGGLLRGRLLRRHRAGRPRRRGHRGFFAGGRRGRGLLGGGLVAVRLRGGSRLLRRRLRGRRGLRRRRAAGRSRLACGGLRGGALGRLFVAAFAGAGGGRFLVRGLGRALGPVVTGVGATGRVDGGRRSGFAADADAAARRPARRAGR